MSNLSGYDSEAIGFDSISQESRPEVTASTQTDYGESGVSTQTAMYADCGSTATPEDLVAQDDVLKEYPPPGLNEFLRKVVPGMLEQLDQTSRDVLYNSSDSDEEDALTAKMVQELMVSDLRGAGGDQPTSVLDLSWSSAGNSLAVSIGKTQHQFWCTDDGMIRIYTMKPSAGEKFAHSCDISEKSCVSVVKYHPSIAALLAYGTASGEVVLCNLRNSEEDMQLTSPADCHGAKRVSALMWADAPLANIFLTIQITNTGKRRVASDQILLSSASDGSLNAWRVNANLKIFEIVESYAVNSARKTVAPDITCFDFIKTYPLRPSGEKVPDDVFVVGTKTGSLFLCKIKGGQKVGEATDPVYEVLDGHSTCVMAVAFSLQKPGIFASVSIDSELKVYDINQTAPLKVLCLDVSISCMAWLPHNPSVVAVGVSGRGGPLRLYNVRSGSPVKVEGLTWDSDHKITAIAINQSGWCRIAAGDCEGRVRVWELPARRIKLAADELDF
ncbi:cytoplasmic dynein 2 intermediate chain 2 [Manduca sexta]|uniref:cytoplasmic dynein 2 intermediate chain 2 n=1 Tax=Manduca sexta TaxID=7130 RepID=UPI0018908F4B|nr:cytoplasmic dynein 2 intermediate chain 2 [Manduca sexta]